MSEYQHVKGVPLVVKDEATGGFRTIPYAERTDVGHEVSSGVDSADEVVTFDRLGLKFPTEEARRAAFNDLNGQLDAMESKRREGLRDIDFMRPIGSTVTTRVISPPSRAQMHAELDQEIYDENRRT